MRRKISPASGRLRQTPRRRQAPRRLRGWDGLARWTRHLRMLATGLAVVAAVAGGIFLYASGAASRLSDSLAETAADGVAAMGFRVEEVAVTGRERTGADVVLSALGVRRGDRILDFDPAAAREALVALPWIKEAQVRRRLPDAIHVALTERRPLALWQHDGRYALIDEEGAVLVEDASQAWFSLPLVVGDGAPDAARAHLELLSGAPAVARRIDASVRMGSRRWDLHLDNGVVVQLPERGEAEAILRLGRILVDGQLDQYDVVRVDLRLEDRMVIETSPLASEQQPPAGGNT